MKWVTGVISPLPYFELFFGAHFVKSLILYSSHQLLKHHALVHTTLAKSTRKIQGVFGYEFTLHSKDPKMVIKNRKDVDIIDILQNYTFLHASTCGSNWWQNQFQSKANQLSLMSIGVWGYGGWVGNYEKIILIGWEQEFDHSTRALNSHDSKLAFKG